LSVSSRYPFQVPVLTKEEQENGSVFCPQFDENGLIACVITDFATKNILMVAYMNAEALNLTLESGEAWYWSRSRKELWHKGETSGQIQKIKSIKTDCDQDTLLIEVDVQGDGGCCHTGQRSCFFRTLSAQQDGTIRLEKLL